MLDGGADATRATQDVERHQAAPVLVWRTAPGEPPWGEATGGGDEAQPGQEGLEAADIGDVKLDAFTELARPLVKGRAEPCRAKVDSGKAQGGECVGIGVGLEIGRANPLEWPRGPASFRQVGSFDETTPRVDPRGIDGRHVGRRRDPGESGRLP